MNDADGSSSAAQGAQQLGDKTQAGLIGRLFSWSPGKSELEADGAVADDSSLTGRASLPGIGNLRRKRVEDVAIPKGEIGAVPVDASLDQVVLEFRESGYTRLPVYEGTLDTPLGMIHLKDLALEYGFNGGGKEFDLRQLMRPILFVPPSMPLGVLLQKMQSQRMHLALVIDEYGGTDGLVTIEDLIEQVIGEIEDEHDVDEAQPWIQETPGTYLALARAPLDEFEAETGIALVGGEIDEDVDSLGGLVFLLSGRVPARGEIIKHPGGAEFEVVDADARRVKRLRIRLPRPEKTGD